MVVVITGMLAALLVPAGEGALRRTREAVCRSKMKDLGMALSLYTQDHGGELPRSFHSAGAHGEPGWAVSVATYLGTAPADSMEEWQPAFNRYFRCPEDHATDPVVYSYGLNVFFELTPDGDDYAGSPETWRRMVNIPRPSRTILLAETRPVAFGDHLMCHQWSGVGAARNATSYNRHRGKSNYLFADGHVESLGIEATIDTAKGVNLWNPTLAR